MTSDHAPQAGSGQRPTEAGAGDAAPAGRIVWLMRLLALAGLAMAGFLLYTHAAVFWLGGDAEAPLCGRVGWLDCTSVLASRWSAWFGVPVAGIAAGAYLLMLVALSRVRRGPARAAWRVLLGLATAVAGSAGWFIYVQQARLDAWCGLCMAEHAIGLVLAALVILYATGATGGGGWAAALAGLLAVAALIGGQLLDEPQYIETVQWQTRQDRWIETDHAARALGLLDGNVVLDRRAYPILGNDAADRLIVEVMDYTCKRCGRFSPTLHAAAERLGEHVAVLIVHVPLDAECNPMLSSTAKHYEDACELARLALGVWLADPAAFDRYHRWLLSQQEQMTRARARARARRLVGGAALDAALAQPAVDRMIERNSRLAAHMQIRSQPGLVVGDMRFSALPADAQTLAQLVLGIWSSADRSAGGPPNGP